MYAIPSVTLLGLGLGLLLAMAARWLRVEGDPLVEELVALMPNSQCGQCGYAGCGIAAEAIARGEAPVTLCPPGGRSLAEALASRLGLSVDLSAVEECPEQLALVDESNCIGCTRCIKVCPTDAIIGGPRQIHVVLRDACTGCGKCVAICPTECLQVHLVTPTLNTWQWPLPASQPAVV